MDDRELVRQLGPKSTRLAAMRALVGGVTANELRDVRLSDRTFDALRDGLADPDPRVRWWCIQLLDHVPEPRALTAIAGGLDDPVPRVRRNATHALGCVACKPGASGDLPAELTARLQAMATDDPNGKVRAEARHTLACRARG